MTNFASVPFALAALCLVSLCPVFPASASPDAGAAVAENGDGQKLREAAESWRKAAEEGNAEAQISLALALACGRRFAPNADQERVKQDGAIIGWLHKAADQGNPFATRTVRMLTSNDTEAVLLTMQAMCAVKPGSGGGDPKAGIAAIVHELQPTAFKWPQQGSVSLTLPARWNTRTRPGDDAFYIMATPRNTEATVTVEISLIASPSRQPPDADRSRSTLQVVTQPILEQSVEKTFDPHPFAFTNGTGWMARFTDATLVGKPYQPGKFKFVATAVADLDDRVFLVATILFDDPTQPDVALSMALLASLQFESASGKPAETADTAFTFTTPQSPVSVRITDAAFHPDSSAPATPESFRLLRADPDLILSGRLVPASDYKGLKEFWQSEIRSPAYAGDRAPTRVEMRNLGRWEVVAFDMPMPEGTSANLRAQRVEAGTLIDLQLSTASARPVAELRALLLDALAKVELVTK